MDKNEFSGITTPETKKIETVEENGTKALPVVNAGAENTPGTRRRRSDKYAGEPAPRKDDSSRVRIETPSRVPSGKLDGTSLEEENRKAANNPYARRPENPAPRYGTNAGAPAPYSRRPEGTSARYGTGEDSPYRRPDPDKNGERVRVVYPAPAEQPYDNTGYRSNEVPLRREPVREYPRNKYGEAPGARIENLNDPEKPRRKGFTVLLVVLLVIGALLALILLIPEDAPGIPGTIKNGVTGMVKGIFGSKEPEPVSARNVTVTGETGVAPGTVLFTVITDKRVGNVRLVDEEGYPVEAEQILVNNTDDKIWNLSMDVPDGYEGMIRVQVQAEDSENWIETDYYADVAVAAPPVATPTPEPLPEVIVTPEIPTEDPFAFYGDPMETPEPEEEDDPVAVTPEPVWTPEPTETPEPTATPEPTPEPTETPEPTATPALEAKADESAPANLIVKSKIWDGTKSMDVYNRAIRDTLAMPIVGQYSRTGMGILTFRNDAFRQNAATGTVSDPTGLEIIWEAKAGYAKGAKTNYYGIGWTGQPLIVKWSKEVREKSNIKAAKKEVSGLKEVIVAGMDGMIYFLDLNDGEETRNPIKVGYPMRGTPSLHPSGKPHLFVGQYARKMKSGTGSIGLRSYNLYNQKEMTMIDGLDGKMKRGPVAVGSFETSPLIDRTSDTMITAGSNGLLYVTKLNGTFDYNEGKYSWKPSTIVASYQAKDEKTDNTSVEASVAMYDHYVFMADMGGILQCVDTSTMSTMWALNTGDSVESTLALDLNGDDAIDLYTANEVSLRKTGEAEIRCVDAMTGALRWKTGVEVKKDTKNNTVAGFRASPVVGEKGLGDYVYYTVTGLSDAGCQTLNIASGNKSAIIALEKTSGDVVWAYGMSSTTYSSPVAVYDEEGKGWIIQAEGNGTLVLLDGTKGGKIADLDLKGNIEASPAVYGNILVIGTSSKNGSAIYGVAIR